MAKDNKQQATEKKDEMDLDEKDKDLPINPLDSTDIDLLKKYVRICILF